MGVTETRAETEARRDRWSIVAAKFAGTCSVLCLILLNYQIYLQQPPTRSFVLSYPIVISEWFLLTPLLVVIVFRHFVGITFIYASVLLIILAGRTYYLAKYYFVGISALDKKFDLPGVLLIVLGTISVALILLWAIIRLTTFIGNILKRHRGTMHG
jgi:hypothetical protein